MTSDTFTMPVAPAYSGGGFGGFGGDGWWIILLLLAFNGGWGMGGFGGMDGIYPWMNQADITTSGFQNQMLNTSITSIVNRVAPYPIPAYTVANPITPAA